MDKDQRGSVLVGMLIFTSMLTLGAAGMLIVAAAWHSQRENSMEKERLFIAAESGLHMGARTLRAMPRDFVEGFTGPNQFLSPPNYKLGPINISVTYEYNPVPSPPVRYIRSQAWQGESDIVELKWELVSSVDNPADDPVDTLNHVTFKNWTEMMVLR